MKSNPRLRIVNDVSSQNQDTGVSIRTVVFVAALTAIASQLAVDGYRFFKKKIVEKRNEIANNPDSIQLPQIPQALRTLLSNPKTETGLTEEDLKEWERELGEREAKLRVNRG